MCSSDPRRPALPDQEGRQHQKALVEMPKGQGCQVPPHQRWSPNPPSQQILQKGPKTAQQVEIVLYAPKLSNSKTASAMVSAWLFIPYLTMSVLFSLVLCVFYTSYKDENQQISEWQTPTSSWHCPQTCLTSLQPGQQKQHSPMQKTGQRMAPQMKEAAPHSCSTSVMVSRLHLSQDIMIECRAWSARFGYF